MSAKGYSIDLNDLFDEMEEEHASIVQCKVCNGIVKIESIAKKICSGCLNELVKNFAVEFDGEYTFEEYVESVLLAKELTEDKKDNTPDIDFDMLDEDDMWY